MSSWKSVSDLNKVDAVLDLASVGGKEGIVWRELSAWSTSLWSSWYDDDDDDDYNDGDHDGEDDDGVDILGHNFQGLRVYFPYIGHKIQLVTMMEIQEAVCRWSCPPSSTWSGWCWHRSPPARCKGKEVSQAQPSFCAQISEQIKK